MIHRVVYGAFERFFGILIEHFEGKFPLWLSPVHAKIVTVSSDLMEHAKKIQKKMVEKGLRIEIDDRSESISKKVRDAHSQKIPIIITIGEKEMKNDTLAIRTLDGQVKFGVKTDEFIKNIRENIDKKNISFSV